MILQSDTSTISGLLSAVGQVVTSCVGWIQTWLGVITSNPILLIGILLLLTGFGISVVKRLMNL